MKRILIVILIVLGFFALPIPYLYSQHYVLSPDELANVKEEAYEQGKQDAQKEYENTQQPDMSEDLIEYDEDNMAIAYYTENGTKYHLIRDCRHIADLDVNKATMQDLVSQGYEPCDDCSKQFVDYYN